MIAAALAPGSAGAAGPVKAGAASVDASWHVGASAGQYASDGTFASVEEGDPHQHSTRRKPSYGIQSKLSVRAVVVEGPGGNRFAVVKNDFYIPQDLIWRYTADLLARENIGIDKHNFTMAATHNHSSPFYSSTSWGVWTFQDVFDFRFFDYMARKMRDAVKLAATRLEPVRVGASVTQYSFPQRNVPGPQKADDGTPAGFPDSYTDHDLIVTRFDSAKSGKTIANLVNYAVHPEDLEGNDLISADFVGHVERFADRATGGVTIWTQGAVGQTEPEDNRWHSIHDRAYFSHAQYAQSEFKARGIASQIVDTSRDVKANTPADPTRFAPMRSTFENSEIRFANRWFPGPASHPYPGVSNCRTESALQGDPRAPVVGLPDCQGPRSEVSTPDPSKDTGVTTDTLKERGIPVPDNYSAPSYTGLEENVSVHLQAFRIGDILWTVCSCEQWADQSKNIKTRTDRKQGNEWLGYDWFPQCTKKNNGTYGGPTNGYGTGTWDCPDPRGDGTLKDLPDKLVQRFHRQVTNPANGWDSLANVHKAESEPADLTKIWGNYTHDDTNAAPTTPAQRAQNAALGYRVTAAMGMGNDYNGYIVTYREYQRGDHYRKALNAWGPHASDYMATRLVRLGRWLKAPGTPDPFPVMPGGNDVHDEWPGGGVKTSVDLAFNDRRAAGIGDIARTSIPAYEASLPDDTPAKVVDQPKDVRRFHTAFFRWHGGSNYTDMPNVRVQRRSGGAWSNYAGMQGELPVTLKFPSAGELPAYRQGGFSFRWTAHFETFVSQFELRDRPRATPPGIYRFVVDGKRRQGGAVKPYHLVSRPFTVGRWDGIQVQDLRKSGTGTVSFKVGPRHTYDVPREGGGPPIKAEIGPIDYPDSYTSSMRARYILSRNKEKKEAIHRRYFRDPEDPNNPALFEWYCIPEDDDRPNGCTFRPWIDKGNAVRAIVTFVKRNGDAVRVQARQQGDRWVADRKLQQGEAAYVESGDVCDPWHNYNGGPTGYIGSAKRPKDPPAGYSCLRSAGNGNGPGKPGGKPGGKPPIDIPDAKRCKDRRKFTWKIHQPPGRRIVAVNVYVNGKRVKHKRGRRVTRISIRRLPRGKFRVKIVALVNTGERVISVRTYKNCKKSKPNVWVDDTDERAPYKDEDVSLGSAR